MRFAGHQGDVVVAVDRRQDAVAALFAHGLQADHQGGVRPGIAQFGRQEPAAALLLGAGGGLEFHLGQLAQCAVVAFLGAAPVEVLGYRLAAARQLQADEVDRRTGLAGYSMLMGGIDAVFVAVERRRTVPLDRRRPG